MTEAVPWRRRLAAVALTAVLLALATPVVVLGAQVSVTLLALQRVKSDLADLGYQLAGTDDRARGETLRALRGDVGRARASSRGSLWSLGERLPFVGADLSALTEVVDAAGQAVDHVVPAALAAASHVRGPGAVREPGGRLNLRTIASLEAPLSRLARETERVDARVSRLRPSTLTWPFASRVRVLQQQSKAAVGLARGGVTATRLAPAMLGGDGKRTYLLIAQNNAEIRSTGGTPRVLSLVTADRGRIELDVPRFETYLSSRAPVVPLTREEQRLFGDNLAQDARDANITPDFARASEIIEALYHRETGQHADGVLSIDPVALGLLMRATGPVRVGDQTLTSRNVVGSLLNRAYLDIPDPADQDAYFARVAGALFAQVTGSGTAPLSLARELAEAARQHHVYLWSRRPAEQRQFGGSVVGGPLPTDHADVATAGVYLDDAASSKMDYYLQYAGSLRATSCAGTRSQRLTAEVTLRSTVPRDGAHLPEYVTGTGRYTPKGSIRIKVRIYAPAGGVLSSVLVNGRRLEFRRFTHAGHAVALLDVTLTPQDEVVLELHMRTAPDRGGDPVLQMTPGIERRDYDSTAVSACS